MATPEKTGTGDAAQKQEAPATQAGVTAFGHKNPPVGPKTAKPLADWNQFRDYENFNPTAEK